MRLRHLAAALVIGVCALFLANRSEAQYSITAPVCYDTSNLSKADWQGLQRDFIQQSMRGSMALIFPDRAPITNPTEIKNWVREKPLLGFVFPGLNADAAGTWALAKQHALANHKPGHAERPVVAVNVGWTDFGMTFGHLYELGGIRRSVNAGKADPDFISNTVADMIKERARFRHGRKDALLLGGHSSGGFYTTNVTYLLRDSAKSYLPNLRVYNLGIATSLPKGVKAKQILGPGDMVALANSPTAGLTGTTTRFEAGLSHNGGEHWDFGDSLSTRRWQVRPLKEVFTQTSNGKLPFRWRSSEMINSLRAGAKKTKESAVEARRLAEQHSGMYGVKRVVHLKLDHDAKQLDLRVKRQSALANLLEARQRKDQGAMQVARAELKGLRNQRRALRGGLHREARGVYRNMMTDSVDFMGQMMHESLVSFSPFRMWNKAIQASVLTMKLGTQWMGAVWNSPVLNPWAAPLYSRNRHETRRNVRELVRDRRSPIAAPTNRAAAGSRR
ncbi:MAG: hypothetical protein ACK2U9_19775 [Anaerolineae bacterium]|jgi:hypothetical protein